MQACYDSDSLYISFGGIDTVIVTRCCNLIKKGIPKKEFFNKTIKELSVDSITNEIQVGAGQYCDHNCKFNCIKKVFVGAVSVCNLHCYHCIAGFDPSIGGKTNEMPLQEIHDRKQFFFEILNSLRDKHLNLIGFDGSGEIFIYYNDIINYLKSIGPNDTETIQFLTNATLLDEKKIVELYKLSKQTKVKYNFVVSIDGLSKETFTACRPGASFEKVMKNFNLLKKLFFTAVTFTVKRPNLVDAKSVIKSFKDMGADAVWVKYDFFDEEYCAHYLEEC